MNWLATFPVGCFYLHSHSHTWALRPVLMVGQGAGFWWGWCGFGGRWNTSWNIIIRWLQRRHRILAPNLLKFRPGDVFFEDSGKAAEHAHMHNQRTQLDTTGMLFQISDIFKYTFLGMLYASNSLNPVRMNGFKHFKLVNSFVLWDGLNVNHRIKRSQNG